MDTELHRMQEVSGMAGHTRGPEEVVTKVCWVLTHVAPTKKSHNALAGI